VRNDCERLEAVYAEEINAFIYAARGKLDWPFNYRKIAMLMGTLAAAERSAFFGLEERVDPAKPPAMLPDRYSEGEGL